MSAIAALRTSVLKMLDDATSTRFTTDQADAAIRSALREYSQTRPLLQTYNVDGAGVHVMELPADFQPVKIISVELHDENADPQTPLTFYAYQKDSQWFLELLHYLPETDESLDLIYTLPHTIDGLDSAAGTTIPAADEPALQLGAAGYACLFRAVGRSESVNLQPDVQKKLSELALTFLRDFRTAIRKPAGVSFGSLPAVPTNRF